MYDYSQEVLILIKYAMEFKKRISDEDMRLIRVIIRNIELQREVTKKEKEKIEDIYRRAAGGGNFQMKEYGNYKGR